MIILNKHTQHIVEAGVTAALYVVLTMVSTALGISSGAIQLRLSEALCVLPAFTPAAIPGLAIGCALANLLSGCIVWDVIFGALATLIGALGTYILRKHKLFSLLPPVISNSLVIPLVLAYGYSTGEALWFLVLTVAAGEIVSAGVLGWLTRTALEKRIRLRDAFTGKSP